MKTYMQMCAALFDFFPVFKDLLIKLLVQLHENELTASGELICPEPHDLRRLFWHRFDPLNMWGMDWASLQPVTVKA